PAVLPLHALLPPAQRHDPLPAAVRRRQRLRGGRGAAPALPTPVPGLLERRAGAASDEARTRLHLRAMIAVAAAAAAAAAAEVVARAGTAVPWAATGRFVPVDALATAVTEGSSGSEAFPGEPQMSRTSLPSHIFYFGCSVCGTPYFKNLQAYIMEALSRHSDQLEASSSRLASIETTKPSELRLCLHRMGT
ncbi:Protein of unknown function, partial [Gryllus bimaculatus]